MRASRECCQVLIRRSLISSFGVVQILVEDQSRVYQVFVVQIQADKMSDKVKSRVESFETKRHFRSPSPSPRNGRHGASLLLHFHVPSTAPSISFVIHRRRIFNFSCSSIISSGDPHRSTQVHKRPTHTQRSFHNFRRIPRTPKGSV